MTFFFWAYNLNIKYIDQHAIYIIYMSIPLYLLISVNVPLVVYLLFYYKKKKTVEICRIKKKNYFSDLYLWIARQPHFTVVK